MKRKVSKIFQCSLIFIVIIGSAVAILPETKSAIPFYFTLILKTSNTGVNSDYCNLLKQHCTRIGINIEVIVQDWPTFMTEILIYRNFDIAYFGFADENTRAGNPDMTGVYNENGSLNLFGYHTDMDYDPALGTGKNQWYMRQANLIIPPDSAERIQHYWDWQQYLMDKICPMLPVFSGNSTDAYWNNLQGYVKSKGLLQSWGNIKWTGLHLEQNTPNEVVISDKAWSNLNPLFQNDSASRYISKQCLDPLIWYDSDGSLWPHLTTNWTFINDTTIQLELRNNIYWQNYSTFTNEPFDVDDVYFTFYAWKHLSNDQSSYTWIEEIEKIGDDQLLIYIDNKASTPENDPYAPAINALAKEILPEHYLNQTQLGDGVTPDITHESWTNFSTNCFGTGLFTISDIEPDVETTLSVNPESWWFNTSLTNDSLLNWETRFGGFDGVLTNQRIRIIPDFDTQILEFLIGKVDIVDISKHADYILQFNNSPTKLIQSEIDYQLGFFGYNMRPVRPIIGSYDPAVYDPSISKGLAIRKAISYAVDRNEINNFIHYGEYNITNWPIYQKLEAWCNPNIIRYNHDLDKAREYMTKAGYVQEYPNDHGFGFFYVFFVIVLVILFIGVGCCISLPFIILTKR